MQLTTEQERKLTWLEREHVVNLLQDASIQCYDDEPTEELREALKVNIEDGTIDWDDVENARDFDIPF